MDNDRANPSTADLTRESGADERTIGIINRGREIPLGEITKYRREIQVRFQSSIILLDHILYRDILRDSEDMSKNSLDADLCVTPNCLPEIEEKANARVAEIE